MAAKRSYFTWFGLAMDALNVERRSDTIGKLNTSGSRLEQWAQLPVVKGVSVVPFSVPFATTYTWRPATQGYSFSMGALTNNTTITLDGTSLDDGVNLVSFFVQNGVGGFTVTFAASTGYTVSWGTTGFVAMGATASKVTIYTFWFKGTTFHGAQFTKNS